jgi:hypothetical protein
MQMAHSETIAQPKALVNIGFWYVIYESSEMVNKISERLLAYIFRCIGWLPKQYIETEKR